MTTLMEALEKHDYFLELHDQTINYPRCWEVDPDPDHEDAVTLVLRYIAKRIEVGDIWTEDGYICAYGGVLEFCKENLEALMEFGRKWNHDGAQIDGTEEGLYHALTTVQQLANGDYPLRVYEWLCDRWNIWEVA